jgi:tRNA G18 (ribose-2'-O)-methylase SpoU
MDIARMPRRASWALAIGSEARGVRADVRTAAAASVAVPMSGGVDSLNAGVAGAILLYELTRTGPDA